MADYARRAASSYKNSGAEPWRTRTPRQQHAPAADQKNHLTWIHETKNRLDLELHSHESTGKTRETRTTKQAAGGRREKGEEIKIQRWRSSESPWTKGIASPSSAARALSLCLIEMRKGKDTPLLISKKTKTKVARAGRGGAAENGLKHKTAPDKKTQPENQREADRTERESLRENGRTQIWMTTNCKTVDWKIANP